MLTDQEFFARLRDHDYYNQDLVNLPVLEVSEETYEQFLGCVPPLYVSYPDAFDKKIMGRFAHFCCGEAVMGTLYNQFAEFEGRYFFKVVDIKKPATYITREQMEGVINGDVQG